MIRNLIHCSDDEISKIFATNNLDLSVFEKYTDTPSFRQKNCFYDIQTNDLKDKYDLVIVDGPNGNGRSLAFQFIKNRMNNNSYILIDDHPHYCFIAYLVRTFGDNKIKKICDYDVPEIDTTSDDYKKIISREYNEYFSNNEQWSRFSTMIPGNLSKDEQIKLLYKYIANFEIGGQFFIGQFD